MILIKLVESFSEKDLEEVSLLYRIKSGDSVLLVDPSDEEQKQRNYLLEEK